MVGGGGGGEEAGRWWRGNLHTTSPPTTHRRAKRVIPAKRLKLIRMFSYHAGSYERLRGSGGKVFELAKTHEKRSLEKRD